MSAARNLTSAREAQRPAPLPALTGLRFFLAVHVVAYHFLRGIVSTGPRPIARVVDNGFIGVGFFFTLSGFVLAYNYMTSPDASAPALDRRAFWVARVARVYPVYLLGMLAAAPFVISDILAGDAPLAGAVKVAAGGLSSLTLTQAHLPWTALVWNGPGWSLSVEAFLYLAFPFVAPTVVRLSPRGTWLLLACSWVLALVPPALYTLLDPAGAAVASSGFTPWLGVVKFNPILRVPEFVAGIALGRLFLVGTPRPTAGTVTLGLAAVAILVLLLALAPAPYIFAHNGLYLPLMWALIWALAKGGGPIAVLCSAGLLQFLGEASYALYILQLPLFRWLLPLVEPGAAGSSKPTSFLHFAIVILAAMVLSSLTLILFERPARRFVRRLLSGTGGA